MNLNRNGKELEQNLKYLCDYFFFIILKDYKNESLYCKEKKLKFVKLN